MSEPYELLVRMPHRSSPGGASVRYITTVGDRDYEGDPQPLSGTSDPAFAAFASQFSAAVVAERDAARAERDTLRAERDAARTERDAAITERDTLRTERDAARTERDTLRTERDAARTERDTLRTERDAAVTERDAAVAERDTLRTERDALRTELEALRNPTDASGFPVLSAVQIRLGILAAGMTLEGIDAAIAAIPDPLARVRVETYWQYATQFERSHPLVAGMVSMLGLTDAAADDLWRAAGAIS